MPLIVSYIYHMQACIENVKLKKCCCKYTCVVYSIMVENDTFSKPSIQEAEYITPYKR